MVSFLIKGVSVRDILPLDTEKSSNGKEPPRDSAEY